MFNSFCPDYRVKSIFDISSKWLKRNGYLKVVVDMDNTLLPRDKNLVSPRALTWIRQMLQQRINVALITNDNGERVDAIIRQCNVGCIKRAGKPLPFCYKQIVKAFGGGKILFVGDELLTDVWGAKFSNHPVVLVESLGGKEKLWTRVLRKIENFIFKRLVASGKMPKEKVL